MRRSSLLRILFLPLNHLQKYISKLTTLPFYHKKREKAIERHKYLQFAPFYRLNEVFFNTFSHLFFILLEKVSINVRGYSRITMPKVLGNSLDVKSVEKQKALPKQSFLYIEIINYLLENCGARRAALRPYFFLSFILGSRVRKPAFFRAGRKVSSA